MGCSAGTSRDAPSAKLGVAVIEVISFWQHTSLRPHFTTGELSAHVNLPVLTRSLARIFEPGVKWVLQTYRFLSGLTEAHKVLKGLAQGAAKAWLTREARAALQRMERQMTARE
jgi:hypothetical protein